MVNAQFIREPINALPPFVEWQAAEQRVAREPLESPCKFARLGCGPVNADVEFQSHVNRK